MNYFGMDMEFILWGTSWSNIMMLVASVPSSNENKDSSLPRKKPEGKFIESWDEVRHLV